MLEHDGAEPDSNIFSVGEDNNSGVRAFIPAKDIPRERFNIENLPVRAFPIAYDDCGNYILIDQEQSGAVLFWDHETPEPLIKVADDFESFLESLEPFDLDSVQLEPGQVKEVWIDPDFLKSLED